MLFFYSDTSCAPIISQPLQDLRCNQGDSVTFTLQAQGLDLIYIWEKDGHVISSLSNDFVVNENQLTILHVYAEDQGVYKCKVTNSLGFSETSAVLVVDGEII